MRTPSRGAAISIERRCSSSVSRRGRHNRPSCDDHHSGQSYGDGSLKYGDARRFENSPMFDMRRREFITLLGGAAAWPIAAGAQQPMPVIGFLNAQSPDRFTEQLRGFRQGLKEAGYVEGENVVIEYRSAENIMDRLPALAAELVRRQVAVIATVGGPPAVVAAKGTTTTIPIVFITGDDPVRLGFVTSLARQGGNLTGISFFNAELTAKRLALLRELVPAAVHVAVLVNPAIAAITDATLQDVKVAASAMGLQIQVLNASTSREISDAFVTLVRERPDALFVGPGSFFVSRRVQLAHLIVLAQRA